MEVVNALGRRKSAVARIFVSEGTGKITINKRDLAVYFPSSILQYVVKQPLNKLGVAEKYDIKVNLNGGGFTGQSQALRLAIARALVKINPEDKAALRAEGFMTRDPRAVERKNVRKHAADSSSANVKSWSMVGADKLHDNSQLLPLNSQLIKRLASKLPGLLSSRGGTDYPAVGLGKTKKKVNDLRLKRQCQEQILIHYWRPVATLAT